MQTFTVHFGCLKNGCLKYLCLTCVCLEIEGFLLITTYYAKDPSFHKMLSLKIPKPKSDLSMKLSLICTFSPLSGYFRVWFVSRNVIMMSFL